MEQIAVVRWVLELLERVTGRVGERHRRYVEERVGPLEDFLDVAYAGVDLMRSNYEGRDEAEVHAADVAHSRELFLEMARELAPMRHAATAAAHAIGDDRLTEAWRKTETMLLVLSTFLQLAQEVRGNRRLVRSVFDDTILPLTAMRDRIRQLLK